MRNWRETVLPATPLRVARGGDAALHQVPRRGRCRTEDYQGCADSEPHRQGLVPPGTDRARLHGPSQRPPGAKFTNLSRKPFSHARLKVSMWGTCASWPCPVPVAALPPADRLLRVGQRRAGARSHRRRADPQVERPDSRRPRSAVNDPQQPDGLRESAPRSCPLVGRPSVTSARWQSWNGCGHLLHRIPRWPARRALPSRCGVSAGC